MSIILFPHSQIPEHELRNIIALFGSLKIFRPWYIEQSSTLEEFAYRQYVNLINPPENLKPREEFEILLSEYHTWIERNQDKSYREILKRDQGHSTNEDATWEIRHLMKQMGQNAKVPEEDRVFNWHLILHLANEIETRSMEANRLFRILKDRKPLLDGSAEGVDPSVSPLADLPSFTPETLFHESHISKIMDAWFGLFSEYLGDNEVFITIDRRILEYIIEKWDSITFDDESITDFIIKFKIPELSDNNELDEMRPTDIEFNGRDALRRYISRICEDPVVNLHAIEAWSKDFKSPDSSEFQNEFIDITLIHFPKIFKKDFLKGDEFLGHFSGNSLFVMEQG